MHKDFIDYIHLAQCLLNHFNSNRIKGIISEKIIKALRELYLTNSSADSTITEILSLTGDNRDKYYEILKDSVEFKDTLIQNLERILEACKILLKV